MSDQGTILAVDDTSESLALLVKTLTAAGYKVLPADSGELALAAVAANPPDLILLDVRMKGVDGIEVCRRLKAREETRHIPIILISAFADAKEWVEGLQLGAADYITKPFQREELLTRVKTHLALHRMDRSLLQQAALLSQANEQLRSEMVQRQRVEDEQRQNIVRSERSRLAMLSTLEDQKQSEAALRKSEQEFRSLAESMPQIVWITRADGWNIYFNEQWMEYTGLTLEQSYGHGWNTPFHPDDKQRAWDAWQRAIQHNDTYSVECRLRRADGSYRWWLIRGVPVRNATGGILKWFGTCTDIEDIKQAEKDHSKLQAQFAQVQKMESVGRLAGGVAHDFNNMLMGIMGYTELCRDTITSDHPIREWLNEIILVVERSAQLTHQLLAFARKQVIAPKVLDINDAVSGMLKLLRRLIGEDVTMKFLAAPDTWPVKMDPAQIDQILANLCVNARDAIGGVGSVTIAIGNAVLDEAYCAEHLGSLPGDYALLTVTDTGCGMDKETLEHIFEPFFTTKGAGEGTGLGLATVFGIVKQNNGFVEVYSEPGKGTTFKIYLPRFVSAEVVEVAVKTLSVPPRGTETVLLVEDEKSIRVTTSLSLEDLGYTLLVAESPEQALRLVAQHPGEIHLLITDVIMPGMSGHDLANRLLELRPTIKILFISGFTSDIIAWQGILSDGVNFLAKPFGRDQIARKVREVLEGTQGRKGGA